MSDKIREEAIIAVADVIKREAKRHHRDLTNAIEDFDEAPDHQKADEALALLSSTKDCEQRFTANISRALVGMLETVSGKSLRELVEDADGADVIGMALGISPDGTINHKLLSETDAEEPGFDTTPSGNPRIEGIDFGADEAEDESDIDTGDWVRGTEGDRKGMVIGRPAPNERLVRYFGDDAPAEPKSEKVADLTVVPLEEVKADQEEEG